MEELLFLKMSNIMKKQKKKGWTKDLIEKKKNMCRVFKIKFSNKNYNKISRK